MAATIPSDVIGTLREALVRLKNGKLNQEIVVPQEAVLARFQPMFSLIHIGEITEDDFLSFLQFKNNRHWSGLHRQGPRICKSIDDLRKGLALLLDESIPIEDRLDKTLNRVSGMGKNIATAVLLVSNPEKYGVWNNRSEASIQALKIWPKFNWGESFGKRYKKVNEVLIQIRDLLQTDLWTLDAIWWHMGELDYPPIDEDSETLTSMSIENEQRFSLERHLHDFMRDNWDHLELGKEWNLYGRPEDDDPGYEYPTDVGRIDLLAKHKKEDRWLVIELKRNKTSDTTVGQLLRYIGWVKQNLAEKDDIVEGMIICREADDALHYALSTVQYAKLRFYEVEFHLKKPDNLIGNSL